MEREWVASECSEKLWFYCRDGEVISTVRKNGEDLFEARYEPPFSPGLFRRYISLDAAKRGVERFVTRQLAPLPAYVKVDKEAGKVRTDMPSLWEQFKRGWNN